jgi:hypothetical protein
MPYVTDSRRRFLRNATVAFAAAELATIGSADAQSTDKPCSGAAD